MGGKDGFEEIYQMAGALITVVMLFNACALFVFEEPLAGTLSLLGSLVVGSVAFAADVRAIYIEWRDHRRANTSEGI